MTFPALAALAQINPLLLVILLSVVVGLCMVLIFGYISDQKAIHAAKDHLKAHLLAVRLFQDQLPVVLRSYGRILRGTVTYLRHAFKPLLFVIIPITLMLVQIDRYLGWSALQPGENFVLKAHVTSPAMLDQISLNLPPGISASAPPVHIPAENEIVWRLLPNTDGHYTVNLAAGNQTFGKQVVVAPGLARLSTVRLRAPYWERFFSSGESALPAASPIEAIEVNYPSRSIEFAWLQWNWIVLFFVLSLTSGFIFKSILGIQI
ncbi:MAG TPA: hypothetical protein VMH85_14505 [Terriglobales bacterium]|nr:hypothetical protein [Terriglobales bacterium]